ncbi:radical SAM protein [bacterium]|nr:radical SAM protein [candidate division CSSED10-310 bacterium]
MKSAPEVILLNPPARKITIRDNYCSKISQAAYINHPIDLVIQSGFLKRDFHLHLIDAVVSKLSFDGCLDRVQDIDPEAAFMLAGNASWAEDRRFISALKNRMPKMKLIVSGDVFLDNPLDWMDQIPQIDAILTDFTSPSLRDFLLGNRTGLTHLVHRGPNGIPQIPPDSQPTRSFSIPVPLHGLFTRLDYRYPFIMAKPFATVMTEYGCPFHCAFCVMGTLGHKLRPIDNVMDEMTCLKNSGIRDVFFVDQSFGTDRDRTLRMCLEIRKQTPGLRWVCFSRVDLVDETLLMEMKSAGCHTVIFGVETADENLLKYYRKGYTLDRVQHVFTMMKRLKLRSVATFLLGLPGETWESACETIAFAKRLKCDFASLNVAVPRMGTDLRKWALERGYIDPDLREFDQSGTEVVMATEHLSSDQLRALKRKAVRQIYLDPVYIVKRLIALRSFSEFSIQFREGLQLLRGYCGKNR